MVLIILLANFTGLLFRCFAEQMTTILFIFHAHGAQ